MLEQRKPAIKKKSFSGEETQISEWHRGFGNRKTARRERCFSYYREAQSTRNLPSRALSRACYKTKPSLWQLRCWFKQLWPLRQAGQEAATQCGAHRIKPAEEAASGSWALAPCRVACCRCIEWHAAAAEEAFGADGKVWMCQSSWRTRASTRQRIYAPSYYQRYFALISKTEFTGS